MIKLRFVAAGLIAAVLLMPTALAAHSVTITNKEEAKPGAYTIKVNADKFELRTFAGRTGQELGKGHIHYLVNGKDACAAGKADCKAPTDYATSATSFTFKDLQAGDKIEVELVFDNHQASGASGSPPKANGQRVLDSVEVASDTVPGASPALFLGALGLLGLVAVLRRK